MSHFWFANQQPQPKINSMNKLCNYKNHEVLTKVRALKLRAFVEQLVKEDFHSGFIHSIDDTDSLEYELSLHQDFLYMLRQQSKAAISAHHSGSSASNNSWEAERPINPSDIIL